MFKVFPQIPKDKEDVNVESESQDDPLGSNMKDESNCFHIILVFDRPGIDR